MTHSVLARSTVSLNAWQFHASTHNQAQVELTRLFTEVSASIQCTRDSSGFNKWQSFDKLNLVALAEKLDDARISAMSVICPSFTFSDVKQNKLAELEDKFKDIFDTIDMFSLRNPQKHALAGKCDNLSSKVTEIINDIHRRVNLSQAAHAKNPSTPKVKQTPAQILAADENIPRSVPPAVCHAARSTPV
jgi:hypothetical protein